MRAMTSRLNAGPCLCQYSSTKAFAFSSERTESSHWLRSSAVRKYASGELIQSRGLGGSGAAASANSGIAALATSTAARSRIRRMEFPSRVGLTVSGTTKKPRPLPAGARKIHQGRLELVAGADLEAGRTLA